MPAYHYKRAITSLFKKKLLSNKVLILMGARRVGKTKFLKDFLKTIPKNKYLLLNGEDVNDAALLDERSVANYKRLLKGYEILAIDEAQHVPDIGLKLKLIVDSISGIKVIATGSSVFDLTNKMGEPLVGRKNTLYLYPLAQIEFSQNEDYRKTKQNLNQRLLFGGYPEIEQYEDWKEKEDYLYEIVNSYLLKDILIYDGIRDSSKIYDLLRMIAFQVGKEVSLQELGNALQMSKNTVERHLDLLSKVFVIYKIGGFSRNLRKEIIKSSRWYFYDNGIRNALIRDFSLPEFRLDNGGLWENYLASERIKKQQYQKIYKKNHFWRTYDQQEIDWVEVNEDDINGFEFKWNPNKNPKIPAAFRKAYPDAGYEVINPNNYLEFIT